MRWIDSPKLNYEFDKGIEIANKFLVLNNIPIDYNIVKSNISLHVDSMCCNGVFNSSNKQITINFYDIKSDWIINCIVHEVSHYIDNYFGVGKLYKSCDDDLWNSK